MTPRRRRFRTNLLFSFFFFLLRKTIIITLPSVAVRIPTKRSRRAGGGGRHHTITVTRFIIILLLRRVPGERVVNRSASSRARRLENVGSAVVLGPGIVTALLISREFSISDHLVFFFVHNQVQQHISLYTITTDARKVRLNVFFIFEVKPCENYCSYNRN